MVYIYCVLQAPKKLRATLAPDITFSNKIKLGVFYYESNCFTIINNGTIQPQEIQTSKV